MRLIVVDTRWHQAALKRMNRDDYVVVGGDVLYGLRVTEIIDLRDPDRSQSGAEGEREQAWWDMAQCRVKPSS